MSQLSPIHSCCCSPLLYQDVHRVSCETSHRAISNVPTQIQATGYFKKLFWGSNFRQKSQCSPNVTMCGLFRSFSALVVPPSTPTTAWPNIRCRLLWETMSPVADFLLFCAGSPNRPKTGSWTFSLLFWQMLPPFSRAQIRRHLAGHPCSTLRVA